MIGIEQEKGYPMMVEGKSTNIHGSVAVLSADNLGSNACGGFKEGGTAYRFCRQCLTTEEESKQFVSKTDS